MTAGVWNWFWICVLVGGAARVLWSSMRAGEARRRPVRDQARDQARDQGRATRTA
jgi:hypothetical protein